MRSDVSDISIWLPSAIITAAFIAAGIILQKVATAYFHRLARKNKWKEGLVFVSSLRGMVVLVFTVVGIYEGMVHLPYTIPELPNIKKLQNALIILIATIVAARLFRGLFKVYTHREEGIRRSLSLFNTIIGIVVYSLGGLIILDSLGISITPVLTALGVGGLAVALALQDTLSNLFAGIHITISHILKPGDYIGLSTGEEGTVNDITWRCTTLLTQSGNIIVIPNSKISTANVTNYSLPELSLDFGVYFTVAFSADLNKVEKAGIEEAEQVMKETGLVKGNLVFRVREIGEYGIKCALFLTIHQFKDQYLVRHNLIKRLMLRFAGEGISIPYPTREMLTKAERQ
ncbi:MAG: mechanosensitive ion channel family protein [Bacteroidia bacterium]|jgi:small-conductance mechanosensitive channel|nr:mechanosensitive ion channel family protein [Bacteroidia bacterium]